jgi:hypothetical protein
MAPALIRDIVVATLQLRYGWKVRRDELHLARGVGAALGTKKQRRAVEIAAQGVEVGGSYREVECVDVGDDRNRAGAWRHAPRSFASLTMGTAAPFASARTRMNCFANSRMR